MAKAKAKASLCHTLHDFWTSAAAGGEGPASCKRSEDPQVGTDNSRYRQAGMTKKKGVQKAKQTQRKEDR
jgi:hypothetical protein